MFLIPKVEYLKEQLRMTKVKLGESEFHKEKSEMELRWVAMLLYKHIGLLQTYCYHILLLRAYQASVHEVYPPHLVAQLLLNIHTHNGHQFFCAMPVISYLWKVTSIRHFFMLGALEIRVHL